MIKLIIWDLDGVLWEKSLGEDNQTGTINNKALEFIKQSERVGVAHSICSKNNFEQAQQTLEELGVWDLFVFPTIDYSPKGPAVKRVIDSFQLRESNVLFVDDNEINLNEVKYFCPDINVSSDTSFIDTFDMPTGSSRTEQYRILEAKSFDKDNIDFLKDSDIKICITNFNNCMLFYDRICELANRSNQLNFSKTRFEDLSNTTMPYDNFQNKQNYAVFVWDKYGYYGLVGYFATNDINFSAEEGVREHTHILDFVFSCRVLDMGIEQYCAKYITDKLSYKLDISLPKKDISHIEFVDYESAQSIIHGEELSFTSTEPKITLIAGCLGLPIWATCESNYLMDVRPFANSIAGFGYNWGENVTFSDLIAISIVNEFSAYSDGIEEPMYNFNIDLYRKIIESFINQLDKQFLLIFPATLYPKKYDIEVYKLWLTYAERPNVKVVKIPVDHRHDHSHFNRFYLSYIGLCIHNWAKNKL